MSFIVLCGKSASGKTEVRNALKKDGYKPIITYTTRPKRRGERNNVTYHFINDEEFDKMIDADEFAEYKSYVVRDGSTWRYGCTKESLNCDDNAVIILTPQGYKDVLKYLPKNHICIYLYTNMATIKKRLKKRKDDEQEIDRRIKADNLDFKDFQNTDGVKIVYNNEDTDLKDVIERIKCLSIG